MQLFFPAGSTANSLSSKHILVSSPAIDYGALKKEIHAQVMGALFLDLICQMEGKHESFSVHFRSIFNEMDALSILLKQGSLFLLHLTSGHDLMTETLVAQATAYFKFLRLSIKNFISKN